jgi:hypothetical protein
VKSPGIVAATANFLPGSKGEIQLLQRRSRNLKLGGVQRSDTLLRLSYASG